MFTLVSRLSSSYTNRFGAYGTIPFFLVTLLLLVFVPSIQYSPQMQFSVPETTEIYQYTQEAEALFSGSSFLFSVYSPQPLSPIPEEFIRIKTDLSEIQGVDFVFTIADMYHALYDHFPESPEDLNQLLETSEYANQLFLTPGENGFIIYVFQTPDAEIEQLMNSLREYERGNQNLRFFSEQYISMLYMNRVLEESVVLVLISLLVLYIIELIITRNMMTAFILWLTAVLPGIWIFGLYGLLGIELKITTLVVPLQVFALGTTYSLHFYRYFTLHQHISVRTLIQEITPLIFFAGITTCSGFVLLSISSIYELSQMGVLLVLGILLSLFFTFFFLPCFFSAFQERGKTKTNESEYLFSEKHPAFKKAAKLFVLCVFALALIGLFFLKPRVLESRYFRPWTEGYEYTESFNNYMNGIYEVSVNLYTDTEYGLVDMDFYHTVNQCVQELEGIEGMHTVISYAGFADLVNGVLWDASGPVQAENQYELGEALEMLSSSQAEGFFYSIADPPLESARIILRLAQEQNARPLEFRERIEAIREIAESYFPNTEITVTSQVIELDALYRITVREIWTNIVVFLLLVMGILVLYFRSFRFALLTMLPVVSGLLFMFGISGWLQIPVQLITVFQIAIFLGVGIDDILVFMAHYNRMRQLNPETIAVRETVHKTGYAIIQTTLCICGGLAHLTFSGFLQISQATILIIFGFAMSTSVTILIIPGILRKGFLKVKK
ncbi:MAG: MMPL family transporter [Spirochaetia bacterium]